jgi:nucleotide-binding universal stress UspA family protein
MFKKILLPVDLSERHQPALEVAAELATQSGGEVVLLHVVEVIAGLAMEEEKTFYGRLEKVARSHLARLGNALTSRNVSWRAEVFCGHRGPAIVRHAGELGADLIVLTAPRLDPNNLAAGWGSLSYKVGILAACPVLLVK